MPKGTKVEGIYEALKAEGMSKGKAAAIAQSKTGLSLATGKPPKATKAKKSKKRAGYIAAPGS
jgi:hypothetical protein